MILFDSEKEFEDMLCEHLDHGEWIVESDHSDKYKRQLNLGKCGIVDLAVKTSKENPFVKGKIIEKLKIVELKTTELHHSHLSQIARYKTFFDSAAYDIEMDYILICKKSDVHKGDLVFLAQDIDWLTVYEYSFSLTEGIVFKILQGWHINQESEDLENCVNTVSEYLEVNNG